MIIVIDMLNHICLPSGNDCYIAIANMAIEIVSFPRYNMAMFHSYANVYQRLILGQY